MLLATLAAAAALAAPAAAPPDPRRLDSFLFDPAVAPEGRLAAMPGWLLELWRKADKSPAYRTRRPTPAERRLFRDVFAALPPRMKKTLSERLLAVYLVENLKGNGLTDWVQGPDGRVYAYTVLDADAWRSGLSATLTERERSPFRGGADLEIDAGPGGTGLLYAAAHELAHAYDYVAGLTPFPEPGGPRASRAPGPWGPWDDYDLPRGEHDDSRRGSLHFYGFSPPALAAGRAEPLCRRLAKTPFPTLYAWRNWADEAAELFVLRHIAGTLGRPWRLRCGGFVFEPWESPLVRARAEAVLAPLYAPL